VGLARLPQWGQPCPRHQHRHVADQNERDYAALQAAVKDGKAEATTET